MNEQKVQCRLCEQYFNDEDMSDEHYPAHSVGNDDIIELDLTKFMYTLMGDNPELKEAISAAIRIYILIFWILFVIRRRWSITALGNCILLRGIIQQI